MMVRERVICAGPGDVRRECRRCTDRLPQEQLVAEQQEYIELQVQVVAYFRRSEDMTHLATIPPCTKCPVDVFHHCETTGTECRVFRRYVNGKVKGGTDE